MTIVDVVANRGEVEGRVKKWGKCDRRIWRQKKIERKREKNERHKGKIRKNTK